jgi:sulfur carrier protein
VSLERILVNGRPLPATSGEPLTAVVERVLGGRSCAGVAVARNGSVVPRARWNAECVMDGDELEIVFATQGG